MSFIILFISTKTFQCLNKNCMYSRRSGQNNIKNSWGTNIVNNSKGLAMFNNIPQCHFL